MKTNRFIYVLIVSNFIMLLFIASSQRDSFDKITVREFELIDTSGKQRASIKVEEGGAIVLRLRDADGNIRVKIGADQEGSGLVLLDNETNPGVHALVRKEGATLTLQGTDGKKKEF